MVGNALSAVMFFEMGSSPDMPRKVANDAFWGPVSLRCARSTNTMDEECDKSQGRGEQEDDDECDNRSALREWSVEA